MNSQEIEKPRGHKEDGASFPKRIQYMVSRIHFQNLTLEEEGRRTEREEEDREGRRLCVVHQLERERETRHSNSAYPLSIRVLLPSLSFLLLQAQCRHVSDLLPEP